MRREVYVVAGHKGHRRRSKKGDRAGDAVVGGPRPGDAGEGETTGLRDDPADRRGRDPDAGRRQRTIGPLIKKFITPGSVVYTDEYDIYARLREWGYTHRTVCHAAGKVRP